VNNFGLFFLGEEEKEGCSCISTARTTGINKHGRKTEKWKFLLYCFCLVVDWCGGRLTCGKKKKKTIAPSANLGHIHWSVT
jgi:hypothetical protein